MDLNDEHAAAIERIEAVMKEAGKFASEVTLSVKDVRDLIFRANQWLEAGESVYWAWDGFSRATSVVSAASSVCEMDNAVASLATWLPGYDYELGRLRYADEEVE
jgi:hypothetical protein